MTEQPSPRRLRLTAAVLSAPVLAASSWSAALAALYPVYLSDSYARWSTSWIIYTVDALVVLAPGTVIVGVPAHVLLKRLGRTRWFEYGGAGVALVCIGAVALFVADPDAFEHAFAKTILATPYGALTALVAWLIRRPDRDRPEPSPSTGSETSA